MLAVAAFAVLSAAPLSPILQRTVLPQGCIARFGNPRAESAGWSPLITADGRFLYEHGGRVTDTLTGTKYCLRDELGYDLWGYTDSGENVGRCITAAGYFVRWDVWARETGGKVRLRDVPPWKFAILDYATSKPKKIFNPKTPGLGDLKWISPAPDGQSVAALWWGFDGVGVLTFHTPNGPADGVAVKTGTDGSLVASPDGKMLAVLNRVADRWYVDFHEMATGNRLRHEFLTEDPKYRFWETTFSPDGRRFALHSEETGVVMFDVAAGRLWRVADARKGSWLRFSDDGGVLTGAPRTATRGTGTSPMERS